MHIDGTNGWANCLQIKGGPLLQKQLVHNATIASIVPRWQTFEASQFDLQVCVVYIASSSTACAHLAYTTTAYLGCH